MPNENLLALEKACTQGIEIDPILDRIDNRLQFGLCIRDICNLKILKPHHLVLIRKLAQRDADLFVDFGDNYLLHQLVFFARTDVLLVLFDFVKSPFVHDRNNRYTLLTMAILSGDLKNIEMVAERFPMLLTFYTDPVNLYLPSHKTPTPLQLIDELRGSKHYPRAMLDQVQNLIEKRIAVKFIDDLFKDNLTNGLPAHNPPEKGTLEAEVKKASESDPALILPPVTDPVKPRHHVVVKRKLYSEVPRAIFLPSIPRVVKRKTLMEKLQISVDENGNRSVGKLSP